jgi:curved DNA-binding protein
MPQENYYKILGVNKKTSDEDIKKSYRKLAMKYHPDHTKGDKNAEEKFKKISEAYAVLSDKEKRKQYDTFGSSGFHQRYSQEDIFRGFDFNDILREFGFGNASPFSRGGSGARFSFGNESPFGSFGRQQQAQQKGSDLAYELPLTLQEVATGTEKTVSFQHQGQTKKISVKIPKGMLSGKKLRLAGEGEPGPFGGPPGDLYVQAIVLKDPVYEAEGHDLYINQDIRLSEAILGSHISVPTISGKELSLKIPPGTKHKTKMRLPGHGLPRMHGKKQGDLYVRIHVNLPKKLTKEQKKLIEQLSDTGL